MILKHVKPTSTFSSATWVVEKDIEVGGVVIPKGFQTDGITIPWMLIIAVAVTGILLPDYYNLLAISTAFIVVLMFYPTARGFEAAVLHDYLLSKGDRLNADNALYKELKNSGVNKFRAYAMFLGVRSWSIIKGML